MQASQRDGADFFRYHCAHGIDLFEPKSCIRCLCNSAFSDELHRIEEANRLNSPTYRRAMDRIGLRIAGETLHGNGLFTPPAAPLARFDAEKVAGQRNDAFLDDLRHG